MTEEQEEFARLAMLASGQRPNPNACRHLAVLFDEARPREEGDDAQTDDA